MIGTTFFVTGTDTGVGKTVLTCLLVRHLRGSGLAVAALKPFCSGGRQDAAALRAALGGALQLDTINPWHFRAPLAPLLAARRAGARVRRAEVLAHLRRVRAEFEVTLIEGAGGLLSPLGEDFNARDLIAGLRATPLVVCPNRLGAINQALLVVAAFPRDAAKRVRIILMSPRRPDASSLTNSRMLAEILGPERVHNLPRLTNDQLQGRVHLSPDVRRTLNAMLV
jgi:dethiobiotin synthetase